MKKYLHIIIPVILAVIILALLGWYAYALDLPKVSKTKVEMTVLEKTVETHVEGNTTHYIYRLKLQEVEASGYILDPDTLERTGELSYDEYSLTVHETDANSVIAQITEGDVVIALVRHEQYRTQGMRISWVRKIIERKK